MMNELHNDICRAHSGGRSMARRVIRAVHYWPKLQADWAKFSKTCKNCPWNGPLICLSATQLQSISSPWPFAVYGMDIIGPFPPASRQRKFLLVVVDYFTKWIEVEPLTRITATQVQQFVICRFGVTHTIITDNARQFTDKKLENYIEELTIKHKVTSVEWWLFTASAPRLSKVIIVPKDGYRSHKEQWIIKYNNR